MIKTIKQIVMANKSIGEIADNKMPIRIALKLSKNMAAIVQVFDIFEKQRISVFEFLGETKDGSIQVPKENLDELGEKIEVLLIEEVDIEIETIDINDLPDDFEATPNQMHNLSWLFH